MNQYWLPRRPSLESGTSERVAESCSRGIRSMPNQSERRTWRPRPSPRFNRRVDFRYPERADGKSSPPHLSRLGRGCRRWTRKGREWRRKAFVARGGAEAVCAFARKTVQHRGIWEAERVLDAVLRGIGRRWPGWGLCLVPPPDSSSNPATHNGVLDAGEYSISMGDLSVAAPMSSSDGDAAECMRGWRMITSGLSLPSCISVQLLHFARLLRRTSGPLRCRPSGRLLFARQLQETGRQNATSTPTEKIRSSRYRRASADGGCMKSLLPSATDRRDGNYFFLGATRKISFLLRHPATHAFFPPWRKAPPGRPPSPFRPEGICAYA